ncbi:ABC transporter permease [Chryseolinea sp. T2]|uniref:ABC transporter permease n=1 Tax=Chryseolinea sp. T2 TaxID=3129255 RepID=UPI0030776BD7
MNLSYFISRRITREQTRGFSAAIHRIAVVSIGIGLAACIVSFLVMLGFQETVKNKIYGFSGHLLITKFTMSNAMEEPAMNYHVKVYDDPKQFPYVTHVQEYAHKGGLIKTSTDEVLGVFVKGVGPRFDTKAFGVNMVEGTFISFPDSAYAPEVVVSRTIADKLDAKVGDQLVIHFFQDPPRFRRLKITGIYETNLSEYFDGRFIISDIRMIQRLNDWSDSIAGGLEVFVSQEEQAEVAQQEIGESMDFDLSIELVKDKFMQVFEWLNLVSRQVNILLAIILIVVCVNMISIVLILVMERTQMIGMLKAMGAHNGFIRSIFVFNGVNLILKGLLLGNLLGLAVCFLQWKFQLVKLNPHDYYMSYVPIGWHWDVVIVLNLLTFVVVTMVLLVPTMVIARISPIKSIRFD